MSALAISEFFTLDRAEIQAVLSRYGVEMRLGSALQIGFLKMCGRPLDKLQRVPKAVLEHLSAQHACSLLMLDRIATKVLKTKPTLAYYGAAQYMLEPLYSYWLRNGEIVCESPGAHSKVPQNGASLVAWAIIAK